MDIRIFLEPQQGATFDDQLRFAVATEQAGLDGFFRSDHLVRMGNEDPNTVGPTDTWITLGAIARETSKLRLGTLLTAGTFRYPGPLAVSVAQVDQMSGGRVEFGLGAGWFEKEHLAYGIPFPATPRERLGRLEEQLEIITGLWATPRGSTYSFAGEYYELTDSPALPKPTQSHLPIIVGGKGPRRTPALAARFADEFNLAFPTMDQVTTSFASFDRACEERERDGSTVIKSIALTTVIGSTDAECARRAKIIDREVDELRQVGLIGSASVIAERLAVYAKHGISRVYLQILDLSDLDQIAEIGSELEPLIRDL